MIKKVELEITSDCNAACPGCARTLNKDLLQIQSFTFEDPAVRAQIYVSLNGRPSRLFVSKEHDLTQFKYDLKHREWIAPFEE